MVSFLLVRYIFFFAINAMEMARLAICFSCSMKGHSGAHFFCMVLRQIIIVIIYKAVKSFSKTHFLKLYVLSGICIQSVGLDSFS